MEYPDIGMEAEEIAEVSTYQPLRSVPDARVLAEFDADFYTQIYPDVREGTRSPLEHFIEFGFEERRYPCAAWFWADVEAIEKSNVLNMEKDDRDAATRLIDMSRGILPTRTFDPSFIAGYYHRTLCTGENLFAFYCRHVDRAWCFDRYEAGAAVFERIRNEPLFDANFVRRQISKDFVGLDPAAYYHTEGFRIPIDPSRQFSGRGYLAAYPDIAAAQINPLLHYINHGRTEGRGVKPPAETTVHAGERAFRGDRPTILVCSHEASRSGAPLVGLNLARQFADRANVVSVLLRGGALENDFRTLSQAVVITGDAPGQIVSALDHVIERFKPSAAILNSVETTKLISALVAWDVPVISLVHEFAQYVYPFDVVSKAVALSHQVVFPSALVRDAALRELAQLGFGPAKPRNLTIRPQGRPTLPPATTPAGTLPAILRKGAKKRPLVVGAGWVQPRKGVDLFIETARVLKHELGVEADFAWVGGNYAPRRDLVTAAYLADQIEASGLVDDIHFIEEQSNLAPVWAAADVFFMSSRLDPYPNVALDAIAEGLPVVCFNRATGIADLSARWPDRVSAVAYNDTRMAAETIAGHFKKRRRPADKGGLPRELEQVLSFSNYADDLFQYVANAIAGQDVALELSDALRAPGELNSALFRSDLPPWLVGGDLTASAAALSRLATRTALNGLPVGRIRAQRQAHLSEETPPSEEYGVWEKDDAQLGAGQPQEALSRSPFSAVVVTEDLGVVNRLNELALRRPESGALLIISDLIEAADVAASSSASMNRMLVLKRDPSSWDALAAKLGDSPFLLMDNIPPLTAGADWIGEFWSELSTAADDELVFLRRLDLTEPGPWLNATGSQLHSDAVFTRRMLESSVVGARSLAGPIREPMEALLASRPSTDLWRALSDSFVNKEAGYKVVTTGRPLINRVYDLTLGREPIREASAETLNLRKIPRERDAHT